ncbi:MAG: hypothetical protein V1838_00465 [Patescibacteria group bacterium]
MPKIAKSRGFSLVEALIVTGLVVALVAVGFALLNVERAKVRDASRLADMVRVAAAFEIMFNETNSYADAAKGCDSLGDLVSQCALITYLNDIGTIVDPGSNKYEITGVPDANSYQVTFSLERGYDTLAAGEHTVSELGIK